MISWPQHTIWLDTPKGEMRVLFVETMGPDGDHEWTCVKEKQDEVREKIDKAR